MGCASESGIRRILMMVILAVVTVSYADAGKRKCRYNGNKFNIGEEVLGLPDHCCSLTCASEGGKGSKPKQTRAILTLEFTSLDSCSCQSPSRSVLNLTAVLNPRQLKRWGSEGKLKPKPKSERRSKLGSNNKNKKKYKKDNNKRAKRKGERAKKRKGKCVFNDKKYKSNEIVEGVASRCFDLVCQAKRRKKKGSVEVVPRTDCTCSDDAGEGS
ncbi:uncharacterized protein LOC125048000 [Penaeus chinensis]|uniref:uncharacterized protein LOC125048000 n=1 Tax=Penaeus chinensis TaxID=139456 RepID=UPI001FB70929|nr:uncharacterized protein LOC125048000 [Penaeus chinensis]